MLGLTGAPVPQLQRVWSLQGNSQDSVSSCVLRQGLSASTPEWLLPLGTTASKQFPCCHLPSGITDTPPGTESGLPGLQGLHG